MPMDLMIQNFIKLIPWILIVALFVGLLQMLLETFCHNQTRFWLGTGSGLAVLRDTSSIFTLSTNKNIAEGQATTSTPEGAVSALEVSGNALFAAFATSGENITKGNGLIYSSNSTETVSWTYFDQLVDTEADSLAIC